MCHTEEKQSTYDILNRPIELIELDNTLWSDKCDYVEPDHCGD